MDMRTAIKTIYDTTAWAALSKEQILHQIDTIAAEFSGYESFELDFAAGAAISYYVTLFVRGDERKGLLERAVFHLGRAYGLASGKRWDVFDHIRDEPEVFIAAVLGGLLVREAPIRDLERGIKYLKRAWQSTRGYEPTLCHYADARYMQGEFLEAARIATQLHERATRDPSWRSNPPPYPLKVAAKAYRAEAKRLKKMGQLKEALVTLDLLLETGFASENDHRLRDSIVRQLP